MILNIWNRITFYCNNHETPIPLTVKNGDTSFYACPKYMRKDAKHPDGYEDNERACSNRLSFVDAEKIVSQLSRELEKNGESDAITDYTNYEFNYRAIKVRVLKFTDNEIRLGIVNGKAVR